MASRGEQLKTELRNGLVISKKETIQRASRNTASQKLTLLKALEVKKALNLKKIL